MIHRIDWYRLVGLLLMAASAALVVATVWWVVS
jgi:hypothetical protein